jgi:glutamate-1-semialdehyde 2,1-aminomutase
MTLGTHFSGCHELELEWAERVRQLVPCAEKVRFTSSGTEATLMALRVARLVTGRTKAAKLIGHFHGWHDLLVPAAYAPYDQDDWSMPGITPNVLNDLIPIPPNNLEAVETVFREQKPACIILEPTGGHWGLVPLHAGYLQSLRSLCDRYGVLLIFDEVITGFRIHPGGAQAHYSVTPDLTSLAKILAGGLPGGALCGRADLMDALAFGNRHGKKMKHPGTFNGNPLSAAAGIAALDEVATGIPCRYSTETAKRLRRELNRLFDRLSVPWLAYGAFSMVHILPGYEGQRPDTDDFTPHHGDYRMLDIDHPNDFKHAFRMALLVHGVDWFGMSGMTCARHSDEDISQTVDAFEQALKLLN